MNLYRIIIRSRYIISFFIVLALVVLMVGCGWMENPPAATETMGASAAAATVDADLMIPSTPETPASIYPWREARAIVSGICFEAAFDAAGRVFVLRDAVQHIEFYDLADNSRLCRQPVTRQPFDFSAGSILVGLWSSGTGCKARHEVIDYRQDDAAQRFILRLQFIVEGNCPYELVRPFWIALDGVRDYEIEVTVE